MAGPLHPIHSASIIWAAILCLVTASAEEWVPVPFITQAARDLGFSLGGEEGQWVQAIEVDPVRAAYILYGTDVGGMFRSTDGGLTWTPSNVGYNARGVADYSIDPHNPDRVIAVGGNQSGSPRNGLHLSVDGGVTWRATFSSGMSNYKEYRFETDFDATSFDPKAGYSKVAYWSSSQTSSGGGRLYRSLDGGLSWAVRNSSPTVGHKSVLVSPADGSVYLWGDGRLRVSIDGGASFTVRIPDGVGGIDVTRSRPAYVYVAAGGALLVSTDNGTTFAQAGVVPQAGRTRGLKVSPASPDRMLLWQEVAPFNWPRFFSHDGGHTWQRCAEPDPSRAPRFFNWGMNRQGVFAWHPTNESMAWSSGGDYACRSTDGGASFQWSSEGINNFCPNGVHNFNPHQPNLHFYAGFDKGGAFSKDGGWTWTLAQTIRLPYGGGHGWSGYALSETHLVGIGRATRNGPNFICCSSDGGATFSNTGHIATAETSCPDPKDPDIVFVGEWKSADRGVSWKQMQEVGGVYTYNPRAGRELYGATGSVVKVSTDSGETWRPVVDVAEAVKDIGYDHIDHRLYIVAGHRLHTYDRDTAKLTDLTSLTPADQFGARLMDCVAVDPSAPNTVYLGTKGTGYLPDNAIRRSTDGGRTWHLLTRNQRFPNPHLGRDGARLVTTLRVHPVTQELWAGGACFGIWKFARP